MNPWMAGLGSGLQSAGQSAMQFLQLRNQQQREEELRRQQGWMQDFNMGVQMEGLGYDIAGPDADPTKVREVPMYDGTTRRFVLNPNRTPDAIAMARLREQERLRQQGSLADLKTKYEYEDERNLKEQKGYFESLKRAGVFGPDEVMDPTRNYKADYGLYQLTMKGQNAIDVAKTPRTSTSTSIRAGGGGRGGSGGGTGGVNSLDAGERARLTAAEVNRRTAANQFQSTLARRPAPDPRLSDEENAANLRRWAQSDSAFAANELKGAEQDLADVRRDLGVGAPTAGDTGPAGGTRPPNQTRTDQAAVVQRARQKITEIMASNHTQQEKLAMVQEVNKALAAELKRLEATRGGR